MRQMEQSEISRKIVEDVNEVSATDDVIILTDTGMLDVAESLTTACRSAGAMTVMEIMPRTQQHGNEAPPTVIAAMEEADFVFTVTTHSITHTDGFRAAADKGTKLPVLRGVTEDMFLKGGINTDYEWLQETTLALREVLEEAGTATATSRAGTDVTVGLEGRPAFSLDGYCHEYNANIGSYPPGESPTSPTTETNGTIVIEYSMDGVGSLDEPITLVVEDGVVTDVEGGQSAAALREIMDGVEDAGNMAEFAIGTNPDARLVGNLAEDKKRLGTIHFAIGDDRTLGGTTQCDIHLDGLIRYPTVELDGRLILDDGDLLVDKIHDLAATPS